MTESATNRLEVINRIKGWISSGELNPGSPMPTERELSVRLSTQRLTIRRALAALEEEGVVRRIGQRTRVVADRPATLMNSLVVMNSAKYQMLLKVQRMPGWSVRMSEGVLAEIAESNFNLLLIHPERMTPGELTNLINGRPRGVIFPERVGDFNDKFTWLDKLHKTGIPIVVYGDEPELAIFDHVCSNHEEGSYQLTRHMIGAGCRRPLMFYEIMNQNCWTQARVRGYERAMREAGLEPLPLAAYPSLPWESNPEVMEPQIIEKCFEARRRHALSYLLDYIGPLAGNKRFDGLLVATDGQLYAAAAACRTLGYVPGKDILFAGYDNYWGETWESKYDPVVPVATVDKCYNEVGRTLVRLLTERITGKLPAEPQRRVVESKLCIVGDAKIVR